MFINFCSQSSKVVLVGEKTWGSVDNVELWPYVTPSKKYEISIPWLRYYLQNSPKNVDNSGIIPDWVIPYSEDDWINYIIKTAQKNKL